MSCDPLAAIPALLCDSNAPGLVRLYIIDAADVTTIPAPGAGTHTITTDLTIATGKQFFEWSFTKGTAMLVEDSEGEIDGKSWSVSIDFFLAKLDDTKLVQLNSLQGRDVVAIIQDGNDTPRLVGTADRPLKLNSANLTTGQGGTDRNGATVQLKQMPNPTKASPIYTGTIQLTPAP